MGLEPATKRFLDGLLNHCAIRAAHCNRPFRSFLKFQEGSSIVDLDTVTYHSILGSNHGNGEIKTTLHWNVEFASCRHFNCPVGISNVLLIFYNIGGSRPLVTRNIRSAYHDYKQRCTRLLIAVGSDLENFGCDGNLNFLDRERIMEKIKQQHSSN